MRFIDYFRVLLPSWRFFERPSAVIRIEIKNSNNQWQNLSFTQLAAFVMQQKTPQKIVARHLLHNPLVNFALYLEGYTHELSQQLSQLNDPTHINSKNCPNYHFLKENLALYARRELKVMEQIEFRFLTLDSLQNSSVFFTEKMGH